MTMLQHEFLHLRHKIIIQGTCLSEVNICGVPFYSSVDISITSITNQLPVPYTKIVLSVYTRRKDGDNRTKSAFVCGIDYVIRTRSTINSSLVKVDTNAFKSVF